MIIDLILDRRDGHKIDLRDLYDNAVDFEFWKLANAIDNGENEDIQRELCNYIDDNGYPQEIKGFINKTDWLTKY